MAETAETRPAEELPSIVRVLWHLLFREMKASDGAWTLVGVADDGHLRRWRREQVGGADDLDGLAERV